jgi:acetyl-CoA acetyltransferase
MRPTIAIAGLGATIPVAAETRSIPEMVLEAVQAALADAGIDYRDVDAVTTASVDLLDGITASNIAVTEVVGAVMKPEARISADGLAAVAHAACQIWSGAYETILVVAHAKPSMASFVDLSRWAIDPIHVQPLGIDFLTCSGLQARLLANADPQAERRWAERAARRGGGGSSAEQVLSSPVMASPLRLGMCPALADGAAAVVLSAAKGTQSGPTLAGIGHDLEPHPLGDRDLTRWSGCERALQRAVKAAGYGEERPRFDHVLPSCLFPHEEELFAAAVGFHGATEIASEDGGLAVHVPIVAGLFRLIIAARRLQKTAKRGTKALAHGTWGPAAQGQVVVLLEGSAS